MYFVPEEQSLNRLWGLPSPQNSTKPSKYSTACRFKHALVVFANVKCHHIIIIDLASQNGDVGVWFFQFVLKFMNYLTSSNLTQSMTRQHMHHSRRLSTSSGELEQQATLRGTSTGPCWRGIHLDDDDDYYDYDGDHDESSLTMMANLSKW